MKMVMIAALAAAQLSAAGPARATEQPREEPAAQPLTGEGVENEVAQAQAPMPAAEKAPVAAPALAAEEDEPKKKRKSTGDKVLTGAAVILGVGALAVGGLLIAIFVN